MATINERILNAQVRHMVWLERFKSGTVYKIITLLNAADDDLAAQLSARLVKVEKRGYDLGPEVTKRLNKMLAEIRSERIELYSLLDEKSRELLNEFSVHEADFQKRVIEASVASVGGKVELNTPSLSQLRATVLSRPFQGRLLKEWYSELGERSAKQISDAVRIGITQGQTTDQIVRRIRGTRALRYEDGILNIGRREATAVVRTAVGHVANHAAEDVYAANSDIVKGVQWLSTLDGRTSAICRSRDGQIFPVKSGPRPPAHWNCRSRTVPYLGDTKIKGTRASAGGPVSEDLNYEGWLKSQPASVQDEILGPSRAKLFRKGGMTLDRFVDPTGRQYTLEQLKERDAEIWNSVF